MRSFGGRASPGTAELGAQATHASKPTQNLVAGMSTGRTPWTCVSGAHPGPFVPDHGGAPPKTPGHETSSLHNTVISQQIARSPRRPVRPRAGLLRRAFGQPPTLARGLAHAFVIDSTASAARQSTPRVACRPVHPGRSCCAGRSRHVPNASRRADGGTRSSVWRARLRTPSTERRLGHGILLLLTAHCNRRHVAHRRAGDARRPNSAVERASRPPANSYDARR